MLLDAARVRQPWLPAMSRGICSREICYTPRYARRLIFFAACSLRVYRHIEERRYAVIDAASLPTLLMLAPCRSFTIRYAIIRAMMLLQLRYAHARC